MKVIRVYFRAIVVSFEFLIILLGICAILYFPVQVNNMATYIETDKEVVEYLAFLPVILFVWTARKSKNLLFPGDKYLKILFEWPEYWRLRIHFNVGICYSILFALIGLMVWVLGIEVDDTLGFMLIALSICGGFIVVVSIYFAKIKQMELLSQIDYDTHNPKSQ